MQISDFPLEKTIGIRYFITDTPGIGGFLRRTFEDFKVNEMPLEKPEDEDGEYTHFTLEKTNWDTIRSISAIARSLGVSRKRFGFAGTKDKKAVTSQRMAVWKVEPEKLSNVRIKDLRLMDFKRSNERILVGDLLGNEFEIIVRDPEIKNEETIEECKNQIGERGVPNYFGYQRFGVIRPNTHVIGKLLLKGDVKGAVMSYLVDFYDDEREDARIARKELGETLDYKQALQSFPKRLGYERTMIDHLYKNPTDYAGAFRRLHKKLRQMFVHGYQSYIFNLILSEMIERKLKIKGQSIPLLGYQSSFSDGEQGEIERLFLKDEDVNLEDFKINSLPEISSKGSLRSASLETGVTYVLSEDSVVFSFRLPKGNYATMVMREFMKTDPMSY